MKKTLIALMAMAGMACAQSFNLDSKVINGSDTFSAFENVVGYTKSEAGSNTGLLVDRYAQHSSTLTVTLGDLYGYTEETTYLVESVSFAMRYDTVTVFNQKYLPTTSSLTLKVGNEEYGTTGNAVFSYDTVATTDTAARIGTITFTFDKAVVLTGTEETITLVTTSSGSTDGLAYTALKNSENAQVVGVNPVVSGYGPVVRLSGQIIPEPATATLSLLALAGLAARRRRK